MESYKVPYRYKGVHACEAVVLCCIDFRFWKETMQFVEEKLEIKSYDFPKLPGSAKAINESDGEDISMFCVDVPCNLHHIGKIIIINHSDCGAYGGSTKFSGDKKAEKEFHFSELKKARNILTEKFPDKEVMTFYAELSEDESEVEFIEA